VVYVVGKYGNLAEVAEVGCRRVATVSGPIVDPAIALVGKGCHWYTAILLALCTPG
jgi:hypothetical protein